MAFPFYCWGYLHKNHFLKIEKKGEFFLILAGLVCLLCTFVLTLLNGRISMAFVNYGNLPYKLNVLVFYINGIVGSILILIISCCVKKEYKIIKWLSDSLVSILGYQYLIYMFVLGFIGYEGHSILKIFVSIAIMILSVVLHYMLTKPVMRVVRI